jgi:hypothetical protein
MLVRTNPTGRLRPPTPLSTQLRHLDAPRRMTANHRLLPIADRIGMDRSRPKAVFRAVSRLRPLLLRVFGRLPVSGVTRCSEAGVRKASGEETAGEFAPAVVSVYGDLACVCPDLWISNGDHGRVIIVALALVAACKIGTVVL